MEINSRSYYIYPNDYCIIGPGIYHEQKVNSLNPIIKHSFRIGYTFLHMPEGFFPNEEDNMIIDIFKGIDFFVASDSYNNFELSYEMWNELKSKQIGYYSKMQTLFLILL